MSEATSHALHVQLGGKGRVSRPRAPLPPPAVRLDTYKDSCRSCFSAMDIMGRKLLTCECYNHLTQGYGGTSSVNEDQCTGKSIINKNGRLDCGL
jgi:hypothetical protein